jgi:hypothetical protein
MIAFPRSEEFEVSTARWHGFCRCLLMKNRLLLSLSNLFYVPVGFGKQNMCIDHTITKKNAANHARELTIEIQVQLWLW